MSRTSNKQNKSTVEYNIANGGGVRVLERLVIKGDDEYRFYDIDVSNTVIIKDCRYVEGKEGAFIATPSRKDGDKYYPQAYISNAVQQAVIKLIEDDNAWTPCEDSYLTFVEDKGTKNENTSHRRSARR